MALYALVCAITSCLAADGTSQPTGTVMQAPVVWDGVSTIYSMQGYSVVPYTSQTPYTPPLSAYQVSLNAYNAAIASGLGITSTSTPAINGTYDVSQSGLGNLAAEAQGISAFGQFHTGGTSGLMWLLQNGTPVVFPTTAAFMNVAKAAFQAVGDAKSALSAQSPTMPAMTATIP